MTEYIEREATIMAFCGQCRDYVEGKCTYEGTCDVNIIETVPSADVQPVNRWISVEDRLPEKDGYYLVITQGIHNSVIDIAGFWRCAEWVQKEFRENYWNKYDKVLYWQPLPEPPKEG